MSNAYLQQLEERQHGVKGRGAQCAFKCLEISRAVIAVLRVFSERCCLVLECAINSLFVFGQQLAQCGVRAGTNEG